MKLLPPALVIPVVLAACQLKPVESQPPPDFSKPGITEPAASIPETSQVDLSVKDYHLSQGYPADFSAYVDVLDKLALKDSLKTVDLDLVNYIKAEAEGKTVEYALMPFGIVTDLTDPDGQPALPKPVYYLASPDDQGNIQGGYALGQLIETDDKESVSFTSRMLDEATFRSWQNPETAQETKLGQLLYTIPLHVGISIEQARQIQKDLVDGKLTPELLMTQYALGVSFLKPGSPKTKVGFGLTEIQQSSTQESNFSLIKQLFGVTPAHAMELSATAPSPTPAETITLSPEEQLQEYLKTNEAKKSIDKFVNAMKMAGIKMTAEQVSQEIICVNERADGTPLVDLDGNPFTIGVFNNTGLFYIDINNKWQELSIDRWFTLNGKELQVRAEPGNGEQIPALEKYFPRILQLTTTTDGWLDPEKPDGKMNFRIPDNFARRAKDRISLAQLAWGYEPMLKPWVRNLSRSEQKERINRNISTIMSHFYNKFGAKKFDITVAAEAVSPTLYSRLFQGNDPKKPDYTYLVEQYQVAQDVITKYGRTRGLDGDRLVYSDFISGVNDPGSTTINRGHEHHLANKPFSV